VNHSELWTQSQIAERWKISEGTLERWRSEGIGPIFLKLQGQVRYRLTDVVAFEEASLRRSTSEPYRAGDSRR
jgi:predicted site-specific integrase-resolvase